MAVPALLAPAFLVMAVLLGGMPPAGAAAAKRAEILTIDGAIGPAMADYVVRGIAAANPAEDGLIVLRMDTPGGLEEAMRAIIRAILASPVPVIAYVAPSGARAASAGTYIIYAAAIAAMAPGTNLGAATPITLGALGETNKPDTETQKTVNDAIAYIRGLAELNGRNEDWAEEAVRGAASLSATEALQQHVINVIAPSLPALLRQIDGMTLMLAGRPVRLSTAGLVPFPRAPDWRTRFLSVITDPSLAYLLMLLGIWGLVFEILNPGGVLPGLIGAISLLLAFLGLGLLPIDYAGAGLVLLGVALMLAEIFIGAFGVIGLAGIVAFAIGSVVMFHATAPAFGLPLAVVLAATLATAAFFLAALTLLLRARKRPIATGGEALIGAEAAVLSWQGTAGTVRVMGEIWQARSKEAVQPASRVKIRAREGLVLVVAPVQRAPQQEKPAQEKPEEERRAQERGEQGRGRTP